MRKFPECIILTRVGDFYEMYFEQVDQYAHLVNLKKAKRATAIGDVSMAGFLHTQLDRYLKMFVQDLGKKVAISEQIRIPPEEREKRFGSMMYDRKVTRVITAGTLIDENFVDPYENNYLLAVHIDGNVASHSTVAGRGTADGRVKSPTKVGLSWVDLSSGDFYTQVSDLSSLPSVVARIGPRELVVEQSLEEVEPHDYQKLLGDAAFSMSFHRSQAPFQSLSGWAPMLERPVPEEEKHEFTHQELVAGSLILDYVREKLQDTAIQLRSPVRRSQLEYMNIDKQSLRGLEIKNTLRDGLYAGSLLHAVRRTVTKGGARLLSRRLVSPSLSLSVIESRLDLLQEVLEDDAFREQLIALLRLTSDTLRLLQRFSIGKGDADDLLGLARTIQVMMSLSELLRAHMRASRETAERPNGGTRFLNDILERLDLDGPTKVAKDITSAIDEEGLNRQHTAEQQAREEATEMADEVDKADASGEQTPKLAKRATTANSAAMDWAVEDIWIMRRNASLTLERAHEDLESLLRARHSLVLRLRKQLGAQSLTLKWSAQLGHFCHVKGKDIRAALSSLDGARSVSTTKTTRSFYLSDWTHLGRRIEDAKLRIRAEEERVFGKLRGQVIENLMKLRRNAGVLDELDVACSSAIVARERDLVRPILDESTSHTIVGGRHPTVDVGLKEQGRQFTANDCTVGSQETLQLITGPNMAGKSTYLRQNALITILAQTGCFVPASYASIGLVDKIFSRVGSADNLYQDQSTFMVEMLETAEILKQATPRSFVIMDEVGRGTTPEDGVAVGYACLHHLHYINKCRALFATHFHALADMTSKFENLACYCTDVTEDADGSWVYVHRLRRGVNRDSHALKVARLAGMPEEAISIAASVLGAGSKRAPSQDQEEEAPHGSASAAG
ncbi:MutS protein 1 [Saxophila tyrrhenica]|uniref:MutS protein 1 n=1 Tax=Saxophila tyrrhenica TaxID=1690608 RepID=A0AAV9PE83_9PEZI|nr:MutS protein 1 [Saxophila tyrrhenica]